MSTMSRPARRVKDAAESIASSSRTKTRQSPRPRINPVGSDSGRSARQVDDGKLRTHYLIVKEIPKTATPNDVLRALRECNIVNNDFAVTNITMPPPSFPRGGTILKNVHITIPNATFTQAQHAVHAITKRPLFPDTATFSQSPNLLSDVGLRPELPAFPTRHTAHQWVNGQIGSLTETSYGSTPDYMKDATRVTAEKPSVEWSMDNRTRGRRVLVRGMPGKVPEYRIRRLAEDCGVEPEIRGVTDRDDVKRIPASNGSFTSTWVVTTDSVTNACRLAHKLNRQYWSKEKYGDRYIMRAEVIW